MYPKYQLFFRIEKQKLSNVEKGRQVLTKLHQNSPYKPPLKSSAKSRETVVAKSKNVDVRIIKTAIPANKNISTVYVVSTCKLNII